jgi:glutamyl-tRNA synthetase
MIMELPKIQWVSEENVKVKIIMPDGGIRESITEPEIKKLKVNDIIQAVRFGFVRVDRIKPEIVLCFSHK